MPERIWSLFSLIGLDDRDLDARAPDDDWTIRDMIEHTLYWERHSTDDLADIKLVRRLPADRPRAGISVLNPPQAPLNAPEKFSPTSGSNHAQGATLEDFL